MLLHDLAARARLVVEDDAFDYVDGGADDETTLAANVAAWSTFALRPRMLRDVSAVDVSTSVLGQHVSSPVMVAPTAYHRLVHDEGEAATARGAAAAGSLMVISTMSTVPIEDVAGAAPDAARWFQMYVHTDRGVTRDLVRRAEATGCSALVMTLDVPVLGRRRRHGERGLVLPAGIRPETLARYVDTDAAADIKAYADTMFDASLTPASITWLCDQTELPVVVKGVLRADDARTCVDAGASAVAVSNHGGRQLDGTIATAHALADVVAAVGDRVEVYVDGGVRTGVDVLRALALGARAVLVGRPVSWGLAVGGADGVRDVLRAYADELRLAFQLAGVRSVADATADLLA